MDSDVTVERYELPVIATAFLQRAWIRVKTMPTKYLIFLRIKKNNLIFFFYPIHNNAIVTSIISILKIVTKGFTSVELSQFIAHKEK